MIIEREFEEQGISNVVSYSGKDINEDLINRCFKLDKAFYRAQFLWEGTEVRNTILENSQMCFIFIDKNRGNIVGYSYWLPIKDSVLKRYKDENVALLDIKRDYCTGYKIANVNLFLGGEAFVPGYDLLNLHKAIENIFQMHVLHLAKNGVMIDTISFDSVCEYDEKYLVNRVGIKDYTIKKNCKYYYGKYDPRIVYKDSKYCTKLKEYYKNT